MIFALFILNLQSKIILDDYKPHLMYSYTKPAPSTINIYYGRVDNGNPQFILKYAPLSWQQNIFYVTNLTQPRINQKVLEKRENFKPPSQHIKYQRQVKNTSKRQLMINFIIQDYTDQDESYFEFDLQNLKISHINRSTIHYYTLMFFRNQKYIQPSQLFNQQVNFSYNMYKIEKWRTWYLAFIMNKQLVVQDDGSYALKNLTQYRPYALSVTVQFYNLVDNLFEVLIRPQQESQLNTYQKLTPQQELLNQKKRIVQPKYTCRDDAYINLIKGQNYDYGKLIIYNGSQLVLNQPTPILSYTPGRCQYPFAFFWDDGFHFEVIKFNKIVVKKNKEDALQKLKSWLKTEINGWICRQQNREQQRQYVCNCDWAHTKNVNDANPPSLMLMLNYLINNQPDFLKVNFNIDDWNHLNNWYNWYFKTQSVAQFGKYSFKWFDQAGSSVSLNSGLDDFPRLPHQNPQNYEQLLHVDCQSWMYFFAQSMYGLAHLLNIQQKQKYIEDRNQIKEMLFKYFVNDDNIFMDVVRNKKTKKIEYTGHIGYPSLLPFAFGILEQNSLIFNKTIEVMTDQNILNTGYGLASISKSSPVYNINGSYWRGPIWINMNYLVLRGIIFYYPQLNVFYNELRSEIINTVCNNWQESGYFFENYNYRNDGKGSYGYPFTGWTALITLIIDEDY